MRLRYLPMIVVVVAVVVSGCAANTTDDDDSDETVTLPQTEAGDIDMDAVRSATNASQCVKTTLGPCPCNAGGEEVAVNERYLSALQQNMSQDAGEVACPQVYQCTDQEPALVNGSCTLG